MAVGEFRASGAAGYVTHGLLLSLVALLVVTGRVRVDAHKRTADQFKNEVMLNFFSASLRTTNELSFKCLNVGAIVLAGWTAVDIRQQSCPILIPNNSNS